MELPFSRGNREQINKYIISSIGNYYERKTQSRAREVRVKGAILSRMVRVGTLDK